MSEKLEYTPEISLSIQRHSLLLRHTAAVIANAIAFDLKTNLNEAAAYTLAALTNVVTDFVGGYELEAQAIALRNVGTFYNARADEIEQRIAAAATAAEGGGNA